MSLNLDKKSLMAVMLPAVAIMAGVIAKNGGSQANLGNISKMVGMVLFVGGWLWLAYVLGKNQSGMNMWLPVLASLGILVAVMVMMYAKEKGSGTMPKWSMVFIVMFAACWILLGWSVGKGGNNTKLYFGLAASAMVLLSMLVAMPWERKNRVSDGPGMALFALGWVCLAVAKAM